jgi:hypothetical protein
VPTIVGVAVGVSVKVRDTSSVGVNVAVVVIVSDAVIVAVGVIRRVAVIVGVLVIVRLAVADKVGVPFVRDAVGVTVICNSDGIASVKG